jgi:hypothetical protein
MKNIIKHIVRFSVGTVVMIIIFGLIYLINNLPIISIIFGTIAIVLLVIFTYIIGWGICDDIKKRMLR